MLTKEFEFTWTPSCEEPFLDLKSLLTKTLVLRGPDWSLPFHIHTDAFYYAIGAVLGQKANNLENVIYYISKSLHGQELNYTVTEKELMIVVYSLNKFHHYRT